MARTARQRAASRRNLAKARMSRKRKAVLIGAAVLGTGATGVYAVDRHRNVRLYHSTSHRNAHRIAKGGFKQASYDIGSGRRQTSDDAYFSKRKPGRHQRVNYGGATVRVTMKRKALKGHLHRDVNHSGKRYYHVNRHVVNKGNIVVTTAKRRARKNIRKRRR